jgi:hypothetical protein
MHWRAALVALAALAAWFPLSPQTVERWYSRGAYALVQPRLTALSNLLSVPFFDLLLLVVVVAWLAFVARDVVRARKREVLRVTGRVLWRTTVAAAALYVAFLIVWGLNYRRVPLIDKLPFDRHAVTPEAARALALMAVNELNSLHDDAHRAGWPPADAIDPQLAASFERVSRQVGGLANITPARPKQSIVDWYFRRTAVSGMTDPFFLETMVASDLLPFERPFVVAHEWSHLAGLADEGDANFLGWLACVQGPPADKYSGWLFLFSEVAGSLRGSAQGGVVARLDAGPRADLAAIRARLVAEVSPRLSAAGWRVYDRYLKANGVEAGAESYAQVVRLILGVRFRPGWVPEPTVQ